MLGAGGRFRVASGFRWVVSKALAVAVTSQDEERCPRQFISSKQFRTGTDYRNPTV
jgi:hypothetical protein